MNIPYLREMLGVRSMPARDEAQAHRSATPLELLFDLVSVIAIAAAAAGLHHAIADAHTGEGVIKFVLSMFAIWWGWVNYTWFASAYDNDDTVFRLLTMLIMAGSLTMASGIDPFFHQSDLRLIVIGFVIMRVGMVSLWFRAAINHPALRSTTVTYAVGITLLQIYWVGLMLNQPIEETLLIALFVLGAALELTLPAIAERRGVTSWHRHHMIERYGLLNIIVLGETLLAGSMAIRQVGVEQINFDLVRLVISSMIILFSLWWVYFSKEEHIQEKRLSTALIWGYGHLIIYAAGAAVGAGFAVLVDVHSLKSQLELIGGLFSVSIPIGIYLLALWFVRDRFIFLGLPKFILPAFSIAIVLSTYFEAIECIALLTALCVFSRNQFSCRAIR